MSIRVLLVDDHPVVRAGYQRLLDASPSIRVIAEAASVDTGYQAFVRERPDVTVTDLSLPGPSGFELIRRICMRDAQARVLVFSVHATAAALERALALGARGFVSKRSAPAVLREAVHHAAQSAQAAGPYLSEDMRLLEAGPATATRAALASHLTAREFEVFRLIALGHTLAECAERLHLSEKTIANYQALIKDKLGVSTSAALVHVALRLGLVDPAHVAAD